MFQMKILLIFASIFCNLCLGAQVANSLGERHYNDVLLYANYKEKSLTEGPTEATYPHPQDRNPQFIITYIEHSVSNLDEYPYSLDVKSGGIGYYNVSLRIKQNDYGQYDYEDYGFEGWLEIYGVHKSCYRQ